MAVITDTYLTYTTKGQRESLSDVIYQISPEETVFLSAIGRDSSKAVYEEWQTDSLAAAADNAVVEGDEAAFAAETPTKRVGNYHQISRKTALISGTNEIVSKAGRKSEMAYKLAQKAAELKRDIELSAMQTNAAVAGGTAVARKSAGLESWLLTNVSGGAGRTAPTMSGASNNGYPNAAPVDGTPRAFTETILKDVQQSLFTNAGAKDRTLFVGAAQKVVVSSFAGIATNRWQVGSGASPIAVVGAVDVYVSDFGKLHVVPCRSQRNASALFVDPSMVAISYLRPFLKTPLAKTGDAEKEMLLAEWTLKVYNEAAHGIATDLS